MPLITLSDVRPTQVSWLWRDRIPRGAITLLDGDGGLGKSTLSLTIAAAITAGRGLAGSDAPVLSRVLLSQSSGYGCIQCRSCR